MLGLKLPEYRIYPVPLELVPIDQNVAVLVDVEVSCGNVMADTGLAVAGPYPVTVQPAVDLVVFTRA
jgi:hypothetical protein